MHTDDSVFLRGAIDSCYENGLSSLKNGELKKATHLFYSAAENTLLLARLTSGDAKDQLIRRADELCALSQAIEIKMLENSQAPEESNDAAPYMPHNPEQNDSDRPTFTSSRSSGFTFKDVIGLEEVKNEIRRLAIYPKNYPELYEKFKKKRGGGILLYGVPGTGKTMIANAIANEIGAAFYDIKCSDILSKWFGEAEQNIKALFEEAKKNDVSVIFFDEFDALGTKRDTDSSTMKRIIPELLIGIQSAEESKNTLIVIAATNRPWDIDSAFLRPGRFHTAIHIPLPDTLSRKAIIEARISDVPKADDLDIDRIAQLSDGFSGADIVEACEKLKDHAIERIIAKGDEPFITNDDVSYVFQHIQSSVQAEDLIGIEAYKRQKTFRKS